MKHQIILPSQQGAAVEAMQGAGIFQFHDPFGIGNPAIAHWDAQTITGVSDGSTFSTWQARFGENLTQATAGFRPTYQATGFNGLPCVRFDGTDDKMATGGSWAASNSMTGNAIFTIFYVYQKRTVTKGSLYSWGAFATAARHGLYDDNVAQQYAHDSAAYNINARANLTPYVASFRKRAGAINTTSQSRLNEADDSTSGHATNVLSLGSSAFEVGCWASVFGHVDLAEMIVFNFALESYKIQAIEQSLRAKWGV